MKKKITLFFILVLLLNTLWEFSHYPLYNDLSAITGNAHLILASFTDVLWIGLIYFFVALFNKNLLWINKPSKTEYGLFIFGALLLAILVEIINLSLGRWSYKESMPLLFGIGLSPLLQLAVTGIISLAITRHLTKQR